MGRGECRPGVGQSKVLVTYNKPREGGGEHEKLWAEVECGIVEGAPGLHAVGSDRAWEPDRVRCAIVASGYADPSATMHVVVNIVLPEHIQQHVERRNPYVRCFLPGEHAEAAIALAALAASGQIAPVGERRVYTDALTLGGRIRSGECETLGELVWMLSDGS